MKKKRLTRGAIIGGISGLIGFAVLAGVFSGCGPRGYHSGFHDSGPDIDRISDEITHRLDLTIDQKAQLEKMILEVRAKREEGNDWRKSAKQDVINLIRQDQIGKADIDRLVKTHRQRMDAMVAFIGDRFIQFHSSLTPEQRHKLVDEIEKHDAYHCRYRRRW